MIQRGVLIIGLGERFSVGKNMLLCAVAFILCASDVPAQASPGLKGKTVTLTLLRTVSSEQRSDAPFEARLDAPVEAGGEVLLPQGTIFTGEVATKHARRLYRSGSLRFVFNSVRLPDGRTSLTDLSLEAIQPDAKERGRVPVRLDDEGGLHPHLSKKKLLLNIGLSLAIGKIADDASETIIRSLAVAGARYFAWGSGAVFLLLRSKGASVNLPQGTRLEVVFQRDPSFQPALGVFPLGELHGCLDMFDEVHP